MAVSRSVLTIVGNIDRNVSLNFAVKGVMLREHQGPRPRQILLRGKTHCPATAEDQLPWLAVSRR